MGRRFPDAVVTDRSVMWAQPHDGYLFIASTREGTLNLPGLVVVSRRGRGAIEGDIAMGADVHLASRPRALLDNTRPTRKRSDLPPATLSRAELADWIDHLCAVDGAERVSAYRDAAEALADTLDLSRARVETLNDILGSLTTPTQRGTFVAFVVAEIHPFDDGNGRLARAVMNAEYVAGDEQRAVIPTISRNDYLRALRRLSRQDRPDLFVTYLDRVRRWTARMDWSTLAVARGLLERTNAFLDANDAEDRGLQLLDPTNDDPAIATGEPE